ncbi:MAG: hypothetical protein M3R15_23110 [Acidobacteriota bacterium]|nr:hypothetical protein [Acidobacteriota bacterium]
MKTKDLRHRNFDALKMDKVEVRTYPSVDELDLRLMMLSSEQGVKIMPRRNKLPCEIDEQERLSAEEQIRAEQRVVEYDTKEYTVGLVVSKYQEGKDEDENDSFVPEYQRDFV